MQAYARVCKENKLEEKEMTPIEIILWLKVRV